jgi:hypothetical protein
MGARDDAEGLQEILEDTGLGVKRGLILLRASPKTVLAGNVSPIVCFLELYTDSVFSVGIRSVFLGIYHTDTEGKLGRYISV